MSKIGVSSWGEFKLSDMFDICYGKFIPKKMRGTRTPFITTTSLNNGIAYYVDSKPMFKGDALTVASDGSVGETFYHDKPFSAGNIAVVLEPHADVRQRWTSNSALFIATVIRRYAEIKFGWENKFSVNRVRDAIIKLPQTSSHEPDWQYMDSYIAELATRAHRDVSLLNDVKPKPHKINIDKWKEFKIGDLFNIRPSKYIKENGKAMTNAELFDGGSNSVIVNSSVNNGIGGYTSQNVTEDGNVITYSDTTDGPDTMFYQAKPFVGYSHVKVMEPKDNVDDGAEALLYLSAIIRKSLSQGDYTFTNKLTTPMMKNTKVQLPVDDKGNPDYSTMQRIVRDLALLSRRNVTSLRSEELPIFVGKWKEFKLGNLFSKLTTKSYVKHQLKSDLHVEKSDKYSLPLIYAKHDNNGIMYYDNPTNHESHGHCLSVIYNGAVSAGLVFPQIKPVGVWAEAYLLKCKFNVSDECLMYLATVVEQITYHKYSRDNLAVWSKVKNDSVKIPVTINGQPDFDYMTQYIKMMQKRVKNNIGAVQNITND